MPIADVISQSNRVFVDVFIEYIAWSYWWTWCVLPIICNSKHFSFFVFYFNVSNKISSTRSKLLNFQFPSPSPHPLRLFQPPLLLDTQKQTNLNMQNFIWMFTFYILDLFCKFCPEINLAFWCYLINLPVF